MKKKKKSIFANHKENRRVFWSHPRFYDATFGKKRMFLSFSPLSNDTVRTCFGSSTHEVSELIVPTQRKVNLSSTILNIVILKYF